MKMKRLMALLLVIFLAVSLAPVSAAASDKATEAADKLYSLGLFQGKGTDADGKPIYALDDAPTRHEAVTMLVRLLGKEAEAKEGKWETPFTDVDDWAKPYVGYAYANGLTTGTGATTFGGKATITASQYLTFVLRALGYQSGTDFQWDKAWELTDKLGLTHGEYPSDTFLRGDIAQISYNGLEQTVKGTQTTLLENIRAKQEKPEEKPVISEPGYEGWPYFVINGERHVSSFAYLAKPGTYTVELFKEGIKVPDFKSFEIDNPSVCTASNNGDGTFTLTVKKAGACWLRIYCVHAPGHTTAIRSDLNVTGYTGKVTDEPGIVLWWHNNVIKEGFGFGVAGQNIFVADVLLDGEKIDDYTVTSEDGSCTCSVQSDGSLLIEKPNSGRSWFAVAYGNQTARFSVNS